LTQPPVPLMGNNRRAKDLPAGTSPHRSSHVVDFSGLADEDRVRPGRGPRGQVSSPASTYPHFWGLAVGRTPISPLLVGHGIKGIPASGRWPPRRLRAREAGTDLPSCPTLRLAAHLGAVRMDPQADDPRAQENHCWHTR
jgi:hypothetical protein